MLLVSNSNKKVLLPERKRHTACRGMGGGYLPCVAGYLPRREYLPWIWRGGNYSCQEGVPTLDGGYLPWPGGGTYLGWGVPILAVGTYPGWGYLPWPEGIPTLDGGTYPCQGISTLARGIPSLDVSVSTLEGGCYPGQGYPTLADAVPIVDEGVPTLAGGHLPWARARVGTLPPHQLEGKVPPSARR